MLRRALPGLRQYRDYQRAWLRSDVVAGVTVAAYLIPQVMAYATVAGLPPVVGLWATIAPLAVYALLATSRQMSVGPESTTALLTAVALAPLAAGDPRRYAALAAVLALLVGALCLVAALARLGVLADLLSRPVLIGYLAGTAGLMIVGQLGRVTGVPVEGETAMAQLRSFVANLGGWHPATAILAATVLVALLVMARWTPRAPGPLLAVLAATLAVAVFSLERFGIAVVGSVPAGLPVPALPTLAMADVAALLLPAAGIAVVGFSDNALTARAFAARHGRHVQVNTELAALGATNVAAAVTHGFPVSSSGSRTTIADLMGARTQLYSLVCLASVLVVLFGATGVLAEFPMAALGALVVYAALRLIDVAEFRRIGRFRRSELLLALVTTGSVLVLGVLYGVLVAVALSVFDLLRRIARGHDAVLGFVPGLAGMHDVDDYPAARPLPGLVVYRYDAPLFFANAEDFRTGALAAVDWSAEHSGVPVRWFVLNVEANVEVDLTALDAVEQVRAELAARGIVFAMARVKQDLRVALDAAGLTTRIGPDRLFPTLPTAVEAFRAAHPEAGEDP
ncbi:sulfate permease [Nocardia asteroides NBRC 15531]|uniref:Sulfate transporter n=1 Tax=Nocardia asteroides NBRC 15531 TaxID=1110697 RepID=U5EI07_NOCAS|nr:sulfate permease [Nocardia asteroides]TLF63258.1 sulfate permease [Nocardia asteroides NBRC 15531]UGT47335.1 sulfate permease [Nocardia asteroides]SFN80183.1 high affinity sulphate transporter 1 [Nocardia asteroides]VEG33771.1 Probable sulfate transporter Rv1739c/MT1781 [Nocardia asteroides]GAD86930.1 putative sulfate transporter [Nocardia asteroides NBRC 15531]